MEVAVVARKLCVVAMKEVLEHSRDSLHTAERYIS